MFKANPKVNVHNYGLGGEDRSEKIALKDNASSIYKSDGFLEEIEIVDVVRWLTENEIKDIDLIKINIEGGEFELLEKLIEHDTLIHFRNIQVQFHDFVPNADCRMRLTFEREFAAMTTHR